MSGDKGDTLVRCNDGLPVVRIFGGSGGGVCCAAVPRRGGKAGGNGTDKQTVGELDSLDARSGSTRSCSLFDIVADVVVDVAKPVRRGGSAGGGEF